MPELKAKNPYQPFDFAPENFVGREDMLTFLKNRTLKGTPEFVAAKHVVILGDGGTGKTWLMNKFLADLPDLHYRKVHLVVENFVEDLDGFLAEFAKQAGYSPKAKLSLEDFSRSLSIGFPFGVSINPTALARTQLPTSIDERIRDIITHLLRSANEEHQFIVLALDQYERIAEMKGGLLIVRYLATLMQECHRNNVSKILVLIGLRPQSKGVLEYPYRGEIFNSSFSERLSLSCFSQQEARQAITEPANRLGVRFDDQTVNAILTELREPNPYYLQLACSLIWDQVVSGTDLAPVVLFFPAEEIHQVLSEGQSRIFGNFSPSQQQVLKALAQNHPTPATTKKIQQRLEGMGTSDIIDELDSILQSLIAPPYRVVRYIENSTEYRINHDLFADYILEKECAPEDRELAVLQGILDYSPGLFRITEFMLDEKLLDRLWVFRNRLQFSPDTLQAIVRSVLHLDEEKWDVHFQWFSSLKHAFAPALSDFANNSDKKVRKGAARAIGLTEDASCINVLLAHIRDEDSDVRCAVIKSLNNIRSDSAVPALLTSLDDEESEVRRDAATALGNFKAQIALPRLGRLLVEDEEFAVQDAAATAISEIGGTQAFQEITHALDQGNKQVQNLAIRELGNLDGQPVYPILLNLLENDNDDIRLRAVHVLGNLRFANSTSELARLLEDSSHKVAEAVVHALGQIGNAEAIGILLGVLVFPIHSVRNRALEWLISLSPSAVLQQFSWSEGDMPWSKIAKVKLLREFGTEESFQHLVPIASDANPTVRAQFVRSLSIFPENRIRLFLIQALGDSAPLVRKAALEVVERCNTKDINDLIQKLVNDNDHSVAWLAQRTFGRHALRDYRETPIWQKNAATAFEKEKELVGRILGKISAEDKSSEDTFVPRVLSALQSNDPDLRLCALRLFFEDHPISYYDDSTQQAIKSVLLSDPVLAERAIALPESGFCVDKLMIDKSASPALRILAIRATPVESDIQAEWLVRILKERNRRLCSEVIEKLYLVRKISVYKKMIATIRLQSPDELVLTLLDLHKLHNKLHGEFYTWKKPFLKMSGNDETHQCEDLLEEAIHRLREKADITRFQVNFVMTKSE